MNVGKYMVPRASLSRVHSLQVHLQYKVHCMKYNWNSKVALSVALSNSFEGYSILFESKTHEEFLFFI